MKTLLFMMLLLVASCGKTLSPDKKINPELTTGVQIRNDFEILSSQEYVDGSLWSVEILYYKGEVLVQTMEVEPILTGTMSSTMMIEGDFDRFRVSFKLSPRHPDESRYYTDPAPLVKGCITLILISTESEFTKI